MWAEALCTCFLTCSQPLPGQLPVCLSPYPSPPWVNPSMPVSLPAPSLCHNGPSYDRGNCTSDRRSCAESGHASDEGNPSSPPSPMFSLSWPLSHVLTSSPHQWERQVLPHHLQLCCLRRSIRAAQAQKTLLVWGIINPNILFHVLRFFCISGGSPSLEKYLLSHTVGPISLFLSPHT